MENSWYVFVVTGIIFLIGLLSDRVGRISRLPRVTILILFGLGIGPYGLDLIKENVSRWYPMIANITLVMVGFLLGGKFTKRKIKEYGKSITTLSIGVVIMTAIFVTGGLLIFKIRPELAIVLGAISTATAPAATMDVISELKIVTRFTEKLEGIVALDDAWGLILFSLMLSVLGYFSGDRSGFLGKGLWEIFGAIFIGIGLGFPMGYLSKWVTPGRLTLIESLGYIFLCAGISIKLDVSFLLAAMVMGSIVANMTEKQNEPFTIVEEVEWPFIVIFFIIAGATMELEVIADVGLIALIYIGLRISGKVSGGFLMGKYSKITALERKWIGIAMLPQAGVAIGMALVAANQVPELKTEIMNIVISTTIFFEIFGSIATYIAIKKTNLESEKLR